MANSVIRNYSDDIRTEIYRVTNELLEHLHLYYQPFPEFDAVRFPATALTTATEGFFLPMMLLKKMVVIPVWIFTIDDVIDRKLLSDEELDARLKSYEWIITQGLDASDVYGRVLKDLYDQLKERPLFHALREVWEEAYFRMIRGMLLEARETVRVPSYDEYLEHGSYSIGVPLYVVSTWILGSYEETLTHLEVLKKLMMLSAKSIRLANDMRTYEKEKMEKNLNALVIMENTYESEGYAPDAAKALASAFVREELERYRTQFLELVDESVLPIRTLSNVTQFSLSFYDEHDFHTVDAGEIHHV